MLVWGVQRDLNLLSRSPFDLLVIGGGIVGACVARDAALRGMRVAVVERGDFGSGISWNSLKVVHGGLRSLQSLDFRQARAFVHERRAWLRIAPHLVEPLAFVVPTRGLGGESAMLMRAGLALNDIVAAGRNDGITESRRLPRGRALSRSELEATVPGTFGGYSGGALFYDAQLYSAERLVQSVLSDAKQAGAVIANYVEAVAPLAAAGALGGVIAEDRLSGARFDVRASMIVNAAGSSAAAVANLLTARPGAVQPMTGLALNLMIEGDGGTTAFALTSRSEGRARRLFVVPWRGRTLIGTAHYACERQPQSDAQLEPYVGRFVREVAAAWPSRTITRESVLLVHAGMQSLPHGAPGAKAHGPPEHLLVDHARDRTPQLLSAVGPKLTMARAIAEQLVDIVCTRVRIAGKPCETATRPLASAPIEDAAAFVARALAGPRAELPDDVVTHLARWYGRDDAYATLVRMVASEPALGTRVVDGAPVIAAQLRLAAESSQTTSVDDILFRRTELGATARATSAARAAAQAALDARDQNARAESLG
jgi:glycerol-3-phosphate dehydrogenase